MRSLILPFWLVRTFLHTQRGVIQLIAALTPCLSEETTGPSTRTRVFATKWSFMDFLVELGGASQGYCANHCPG